MSRISKKEREQRAAEAIHQLTDPESYNIQPGETVYTISTNNAGTLFRLFVIREKRDGTHYPADITRDAARALKLTPKEDANGNRCIHETVYGMSRAFNIVYNLAYTLFHDMDPDAIRAVNPNRGSADAGYLLHQRSL